MPAGSSSSWRTTPWRLAPHAVLALFCAGVVSPLATPAPVGPALAIGVATALGAGASALAGRAGAALALLAVTALAVGMGWGGVRLAATAPPDLDLPTPVRGTVIVDTPPVAAPLCGLRARAVVERLAAEHGAVPPGTRLLLDLPGGETRPPVGTRLRVAGPVRAAARPDAPGWWRRWLERQGIAGRLRVAVVRPEGRRGGLAGLRDRWREWVGARAGAGLTGDRAALVRGMALGGAEGLSEGAGDAFRDAGLWHLLAVSGQNVAVVAIAVLAGLGAVGAGRRGAVAGAALVMCAYCLACDGGASVARAGIVGALGLLAELRSSPRERWYLLLVGLAALLAHQPRAVWDPGLQLSFAAVVGLFTLAPPLAGWLRGWFPGRVADLAALAAAAGLATAPVVVGAFGRLSLAGLVLNVAAVPLAAPVVVLALAGIAAGALLPAAGVALAWTAGLGAQALLWGARAAAAVPGAAVDLPTAAAPLVAVVALAPLVAWGFLRPGGLGPLPRALPWRPAAAVGVALGAAWWALSRPAPPPPWPARATVTALDVGQGDAILLRSPDGAAAVFDTGPPGAPAPVVGALRRAGVRRLDALVLTHDSLDHVGGAVDVLRRMPLGAVLLPPDPVDGWLPHCRAVVREATLRGVPVRPIRAGSRLGLGAWRVRVLSPAGARPVGADPNPYSLVALASAGPLDLLLTADAESDALAPLATGPVDVLKVSHHGSEDAGLPRELVRLRPRVALISAGADNSFRHPRPETLAALAGGGVATWRTDLAGDVSVSSDGRALFVDPSR
jgi:competence protein ComEC